jgi:hypothetical protein
MSNPTKALIWLCWQRIRFPVLLVSMAILGMTMLMIVYFNPDQGVQAEQNTIIICAGIGVFILTPMCSSSVAGPGMNPTGVGFPLRAEFAFPVSSLRLSLVPYVFVSAVLYAVFLGSTGLLAAVFSHSMPHPLIHFMVLQYLMIVMAISWGCTNIWESFSLWIGLIVLFYLDWLLPDFSFYTQSGEFVAGSMGSLLLPGLLVIGALALMLLGIARQRRGDNLFVNVSEPAKNPIFYPFTLRLFKTPCPTSSSAAAWAWYQRQFRGPLAGAALGVLIGTAVVLVLTLTDLRGFWDDPIDLDAVSGFAFIFFCSVFVAHLATVFGVSYVNGAARTSTFERTLPMTTANTVRVRVGMAMLCLLIAGIAELLTIAILGPLLLENFAAIKAEFLQQLASITDTGMLYSGLRLVLFLCFAYILAVLYSVFITWFAIKPRLMTKGFAAFTLYLLLQLAYVVATTEGNDFIDATQSLGRIHSWVFAAVIVLAALAVLPRLVSNKVLRVSQALGLLAIGLLPMALNSVDLIYYEGLEQGSSLARRMLQHAFGLLPLVSTALALWSQDQLRHG